MGILRQLNTFENQLIICTDKAYRFPLSLVSKPASVAGTSSFSLAGSDTKSFISFTICIPVSEATSALLNLPLFPNWYWASASPGRQCHCHAYIFQSRIPKSTNRRSTMLQARIDEFDCLAVFKVLFAQTSRKLYCFHDGIKHCFGICNAGNFPTPSESHSTLRLACIYKHIFCYILRRVSVISKVLETDICLLEFASAGNQAFSHG